MILRISTHNFKDQGTEWDPYSLGIISIPLALLGVFLFCFPDLVCKFITFTIYRTMKPNYEFEENIQYKEPGRIILWTIKIIGSFLECRRFL